MGKKKQAKPQRLGALPPQHDFFLNPYQDVRFTRCPKCEGKTKLRKKPLLIGIEPAQIASLNKTCRYCPGCDLLIAHKNELDALVEAMCHQYMPHLLGHDYIVLGTLERKSWRAGVHTYSMKTVFENLHDFKRDLVFEPLSYGWRKE
jgi:hypothetical protein